MKRLLSLPPNLVEYFYDLESKDSREWFCTSDPIGKKLGSGGGTTWLLKDCYEHSGTTESMESWLASEKRILLHAGGQSRRLPAYAPSGKVLTPIPVFRWERGQHLGQNLLSLQIPLYEKIMNQAPASLRTLIVSGDVYIRSEAPLQPIPEADVVCYGLWVDPSLATRHGIYVSDRKQPDQLDFMLQKPSLEKLESLTKTHFFLMDIGIWMLSDKAVNLLMKRSYNEQGEISYYDLYSDFGLALGNNPIIKDEEVNGLTVTILPLPGGEFYHYGTSKELISSTLNIQNKVFDQQKIMHRKVKPNPAMFVQNACTEISLKPENENLWIENSFIGKSWKIAKNHIFTGIPANDWNIEIPDSVCVDIVPLDEKGWVVRPYGMDDAFRGHLHAEDTLFMGIPFPEWMKRRNIDKTMWSETESKDIQSAPIFPVVHSVEEMGTVLQWMISGDDSTAGKEIWLQARRLSADDISAYANLERLYQQREVFGKENWKLLADNYEKSVFYQLDLANAASEYVRLGLEAPAVLPEDASSMLCIHNRMLRAQVLKNKGANCKQEEQAAFDLLSESLIEEISGKKNIPVLSVYNDQIVWGRSPVRIDFAGGWTDTPPYSLYTGGNVVNLAIELNGQPPLQVYVKPCKEYRIVLRSIDMGAVEVITNYEELQDYKKVGSAFSIPKAALSLAGFAPAFSGKSYSTLEEQLKAFGSGLEITLLAAIPAGSGLGTSSILASTVLGAINDFCGLCWSKEDICRYTLVLEQLLTTGGGWQDQYGGTLHGVKLLQSDSGFSQDIQVRWLPNHLFVNPEFKPCHLLYYTGVTRTAKGILAEIVAGMFLNSSAHLNILNEMKLHALDMAEAIQRGSFADFGCLIAKTWEQNKALDSGTNPPAIAAIINRIKDYVLGCKLPGAGGGGYLYMVAKDPQAALRIREELTNNPPNSLARFVEMDLSDKGLQISRS
ncbi:bifunctional fucokinase/fucose-1-phosphate guanylyltransferase [Bacteroides sp. 224]|uniref:bifunctional fucokinase/fucose-1-phosphate guanylyltransferase n=1 Tax=Bacteroides sp. 224 TaxID=2302936 RepID=UPI0013D3B7F5|nr:bifunctional fucokinase/fucose-1-phosphate guanylyltransferase [Bacteroides sp. 224]NDV67129.1 bifunctional fucokinase/L-fucose-1-P-guanylyltransferase [Bacteroides sp. 224]